MSVEEFIDIICPLCGDPIIAWEERDEWHHKIAHAECVNQQGSPLDPEEMENLGYEEQ